jgi:hypothetical protein
MPTLNVLLVLYGPIVEPFVYVHPSAVKEIVYVHPSAVKEMERTNR